MNSKILLTATALIAATALASAQPRTVPSRPPYNPYSHDYNRYDPYGGRYEQDRYARESGMYIRTFYNINSAVGHGETTDSTWYRKSIENMVDTYYRPLAPRIPEDILPPRARRGEPDPYRDETRSIFHSSSETVGYEPGIAHAAFEKEVLAIELFGFEERVPADLVAPLRRAAYEGAERRGRHYVLDAQEIIGGVYNGAPVYYGGAPGMFHFTERMDNLYRHGVRYVLSACVLGYTTHKYYLSSESKYPTYESLITVLVTAYDLDTRSVLQSKWFNLRGSGSKLQYADENALSSFAGDIYYFVERNFKITAYFQSFGEPDKKGRYKACTITAGYNMGAHDTDIFYVYPEDGPFDKHLGRVKVKVSGPDGSQCSIPGGADRISDAANIHLPMILLSGGEALF